MADKQVGAFRPDTAKLVLETVRYLRMAGFIIQPPGRGSQFIPPDAPIYVKNDSGEEIPPFACLQVTGTVEEGGQNYIKVDKPADTNGAAGWYLFNGISAIETGGNGIAYDGPLCRMLTDGSAITCGDKWQPTVGAWTIEPGGSIFSAIGADDIETDVMRGFIISTGGSERIYFEIVEILDPGDVVGPNGNSKVVASVTVLGVDCAGSSVETEDVVEVVDESECLFNETAEALVGRKGWATKMIVKLEESAGNDDCKWVVDGLCCP